MQRIQRLGHTQAHDEVSRVVLKALSYVAPTLQQGEYMRKPLESYLSQLFDALLKPGLDGLNDVISGMRKAHIGNAVIVDRYVPTLADRLGDAWAKDTLDFAAVTIATARLQALVKRLELAWEAPEGAVGDIRPACLVGVPLGVQHTLGSTILVSQLRQKGVYVQFSLELCCDSLREEMRRQSFAAVMLSVSSKDHLDLARSLVACSHAESRSTPVIIGGAVLEDAADILEYTGADFATSDVGEAMTFAGMATTQIPIAGMGFASGVIRR